MTSNNDTETEHSDDELPGDILSITPAEHSAAHIESELLNTSIWDDETEAGEFGIQIHQHGGQIALSAGTTHPHEPRLQTFSNLTPDQAREVAGALEQAAENAEESEPVGSPDSSGGKSLIRRLLP